MAFYETLAPHYGRLFGNKAAVAEWIASITAPPPEPNAADLGCATGELARELGARGWEVWAVDSEPAFFEKAPRNTIQEGPRVHYVTADMVEFLQSRGEAALELITCLGNTLPHLPDEKSVGTMLRIAAHALKPGGTMVLQFFNFARLQPGASLELPVLEAGRVRFYRRYSRLSPDRVLFEGRLSSGEDAGDVLHEVGLLPLHRDTVVSVLEKSGVHLIGCLADFKGRPFVEEADSIILHLQKAS